MESDVASLIDTHAHLDDEQFASDLPAVLQRARAAGVETVVAIGITAPSSAACVELARKEPMLRAAVGIHPNNISEASPTDWDQILALVENERVVAIGETGLDRHWDNTPFAAQEEFFVRHLELSRQRDRPVVIHCREAEADMLGVLRTEFDRHGPFRGVMHSFTGDTALAEACRAMGLYLSFAGMLTYKNATALRETAARQPLDRLLVETDSPYLAPAPLRGKRNEPAHMVHTAACLAQLHGLAPERLAEQTTKNARALFSLK
ncbi:MAG: TatD family hydrolase [Gemmataceae bacterium]